MKKLIPSSIYLLCLSSLGLLAQNPTANFSISPNPVCSGVTNTIQIIDNSTNSPSAWSYTILGGGGPGPGATPTILTSQNPTLSLNFPGTYTISLVASNSSGSSSIYIHTLQVLPSPNANVNPAQQTTCLGGNPINISVTAGGGPGGGGTNTYSWSTGSTASLISVTPTVTTTYSCLITGTNGCSVERVATITIGSPTVLITSNPVAICPGTSSTLTATGSAPGPFTYTWMNSATTRTLSTSIAGVYDVTVTNSNGCTAVQSYTLGTSTTLSLTTTSTPSVLCSGNTATVRVTGASSYSWSTGSVAANATVNPTSNTTYTVFGQIGVCSGTAAITLSVNVTPTISVNSSASTICSGKSATLTANGANTYTWLPTTVSSSLVVTPNSNTTYSVRGNNPGCPNRTGTISITVNPSPVISLVSSTNEICSGEVVAIAASGANSYTWNTGSNGAILLTNPTITTTYSVIGSDGNNCEATASLTQVVNACTNLETQFSKMSEFTAYPNPSQGSVTLHSDADMEIIIFNEMGSILDHYVLNASNEHTTSLKNLPSGFYLLQSVSTSTQQSVAKKLIIVN